MAESGSEEFDARPEEEQSPAQTGTQAGGRQWEPLGESEALDPLRHRSLAIDVDAGIALLISTKKGLFMLQSNGDRSDWKLSGPAFLGNIIHHTVIDPRDRRTLLVALRTGHLGPTVFRSTDFGRTWAESSKPPAFPKAGVGGRARVVEQVFWLSPGHADEPGAWYAGTSPSGLFRTEDRGNTWASIAGWNDHPNWVKWTNADEPMHATPDGSPLFCVLVDPRDAEHLYLVAADSGFFESKDKGGDWKPLNTGLAADFLPDSNVEFGHDVHCVDLHPLDPDILYQQNHCGVYRMIRPEARWVRIGDNMPRDVGDIGFPIVLHPRDSRTVWVIPMDGTDVWPRTAIGGRPAVYATRDGGNTWVRQDNGLPKDQAWLTVYRQAMAVDCADPVGVYFGTTNGEVWGSADEGASWQCMVSRLPHIYAVEATAVAP